MYAFMINPRVGKGGGDRFIYEIIYYLRLPGQLFSFPMDVSGKLSGLSLSAISFLSVVLMFCRRRKNRLLKYLTISALVAFALPAGGKLLNGFAYASNRWSFAVALLFSYILTAMWDELIRISEKIKVLLSAVGVLCMFIVLFWEYSYNSYTLCAVALMLGICCMLFLFKDNVRRCTAVLAGGVIFHILLTAFLYYSPAGNNFIHDNVDRKDVLRRCLIDETGLIKAAAAVDSVADGYRFAETYANKGLLAGISTPDFYWSIANPYAERLRRDIEHKDPLAYRYGGYNKRTILSTLDGIVYFLTDNGDTRGVPYGYSYVLTGG